MSEKNNAKARAWCFTFNNWTEPDYEELKKNLNVCKYWIMGKEKAPKTGTPHIQGYFYCNNAITFNTARNMTLGKCNLQKARGDSAQNEKYCSKEHDWESYGTRPMTQAEKGQEGKTNQQEKWKRIWELTSKGDMKTLIEEYPKESFIHVKNIGLARQTMVGGAAQLNETCGIWYWGESGSGKSHRARMENPGYYIKDANKWWCNYYGQETVIVEDLDPSHGYMSGYLKLWTDKWTFTAEFKGGSVQGIRPKKVIVTSQYTIDQIWQDKETRDALHRRFREIHVLPRGPIEKALEPKDKEPEEEKKEKPLWEIGAQEQEVSPIRIDEDSDEEYEQIIATAGNKRKRVIEEID